MSEVKAKCTKAADQNGNSLLRNKKKKENWQLENMPHYLRTMASLCLEMKIYINKYIWLFALNEFKYFLRT